MMDFLVERGTARQLIQSSYQVQGPNVKRELTATPKAVRELYLLLVTLDHEAEKEHYGKEMRFVPLLRRLPRVEL